MNQLKSIGFILDGNRRYGKKNNLEYKKAYQKGAKKAINIVDHIYKKHKNIQQIFLYTLSSDNLKNRNKKEINQLFSLIKENIDQLKKFRKKSININFLGDIKSLKKYCKIYKIIQNINKENKKKKKARLDIFFCFNYDGRKQILDAVNKIIKKDLKNKITENNFRKYLCNKEIIDPQIIIRTSGVCRLSGFLQYYVAYSELFFIKKLWPEITTNDVDNIIRKYKNIKRNFGE